MFELINDHMAAFHRSRRHKGKLESDMNENTKGLDVLVVIDAAIQRAAEDAKQYKFPDKDGDQLKKARSAVAELIQKAETAELALRNLVVAGQIDPAYGHYADDLRAALASADGAK